VTSEGTDQVDPDDDGPPYTADHAVLEALDWVYESTPKRLLGLDVVVRCDDDDLARFLDAFLDAYPTAVGPAVRLDVARLDGRWVAYLDGRRRAFRDSREAMARSLVWDLTVAALAAPTPNLHVHAAVAAIGDRAVLIAGHSGAGKSTLVTALAEAGWTYFSDEVAEVTEDGRVVPYPRPIALEPGSWSLLGDVSDRWPSRVPRLVSDLRLVLPSSLNSPPATGAATIVAVIFPDVRAHEPTALVPVHRAEALEALVPLTFNLRTLGVVGFERLGAVVAAAACHRLVLDGIDDAAHRLRGLMS
jgi:hypothetical protein